MTSAKKRSIINEIYRLQREVEELRKRRSQVISGVASASLSAGSGSKSYTNWTREDFDAAISDDLAQISAYKRVIAERGSIRIGQLKTVRC